MGVKNDRASFSLKRKKWWLKRDSNKCQFPFPHKCDTEHPLQVHHIHCHAYMNIVAPGVSADYPENAITLCRTAHEMIHPDVIWARNGYHLDHDIFNKLRQRRTYLMKNRQIYWVDTWDRQLQIIALINTRKFEKKHPFPVYKRRKHENTKDTKNEGL
jgi:hypothetical protein